MDVITKAILYYIQSREGTKNAILAGGAIRDTILDLPIKDYDFFVPYTLNHKGLIPDIIKEFGVKSDVIDKSEEYPTGLTLDSVNNFIHEGKTYEIIVMNKPDNEEFAQEVIKDFNYGLNMCYSDGAYIDDQNELFKEDIDYNQMSLINLRKMGELPTALKKYQSFINKQEENGRGKFRFRAPCLKMAKEEKTEPRKRKYTINNGLVGGVGAWDPNMNLAPPIPNPAAAINWGNVVNAVAPNMNLGENN